MEQVDAERFRRITSSTLEGLAKRELNLSAIVGKSAEARERRLVPEVVEDGVSGFLVPPRRPDILAEAIVNMLRDPKRMQAMGQAGYARVKKDFTFEAQTEKLERIYREVVRKRKPYFPGPIKFPSI